MTAFWSAIELAAALASASMTCMRPLMRKVFRESLTPKDPGISSSRSRHRSNHFKQSLHLSDGPVIAVDDDDFQLLDDGSHFTRE